MSAQHTPGPWTVKQVKGLGSVIEAAGKLGQLATVYSERDAQLIAAAPALLAALEEIARASDEGSICKHARAAIAKATGAAAVNDSTRAATADSRIVL